MTTIRLSMAQALVKYLAALRVEMEDGRIRRVVEDASLLDTNHL